MFRYNLYSTSQSKVYGRVTNDTGLLRRAMNDINGAFPYTYCSPPTQLIIATWIDYQKTNTRQVSIIMFNKIRTCRSWYTCMCTSICILGHHAICASDLEATKA